MVVLAALLVLGVAAVVVVAVAGRGNGPSADAQGTRTSTAAPSTAAQSSAPGSATPSAPSPTPTTVPSTAPTASSAPASPAGGPVTAAAVRDAITGYYALLPGNPQAAYDLTGPTLRGVESRGNYIAFWNRFSSVTLGTVSATDGSLTATAPVTYVENGATKPEQHTFVLVPGDGGRLLIDSDRPR
ncbi:MAG: Serine/threonine-protein kinase pksC [Modestobacter sp.]|nr:Serine/threonine-protein kinase pksC [Modestobacter sp.]